MKVLYVVNITRTAAVFDPSVHCLCRKIQLTATDPEDDEVVFRLNTTGLKGNVTLTADNWIIYRPCDNCEGPETISFSVIEKRTDGEEALITNSFLTVNVLAVNDNPRMLVIKNGRNAISSNRAGYSLEENNEQNQNYKDLHIILMSYDPDQSDSLTVEFDNPSHGNLTFHSQIRQVTFLDSDCSTIDDMNWDKIAREIIPHADSFAIPRPCDVDSEAYTDGNSWVLTVVTYTPDENYYGKDSFKVQYYLQKTSNKGSCTHILGYF